MTVHCHLLHECPQFKNTTDIQLIWSIISSNRMLKSHLSWKLLILLDNLTLTFEIWLYNASSLTTFQLFKHGKFNICIFECFTHLCLGHLAVVVGGKNDQWRAFQHESFVSNTCRWDMEGSEWRIWGHFYLSVTISTLYQIPSLSIPQLFHNVFDLHGPTPSQSG